MANEELSFGEQEQIRRGKLCALKASGRDPYLITKADVDTRFCEIRAEFEKFEDKYVKVAGRILSCRDMGKACFFDLRDSTDKLQCYIRTDDVGEDGFETFKTYDLGDLVAVEGKVFRTRRGEISIHTEKITLLAKCLIPLPEKFHGLKDQDLRYRQRYLDMIINPEVRDTFLKRSQIIRTLRELLSERGFIEVETPVLHTQAGGAAARPFITHHNTLDLDMYLRIALELHLKRLIVGGFERVFEIGRVFRNEGMDTRHNPEFTMLECYQAYTDFEGMMELTEYLFRETALRVLGTAKFTIGEVELDLSKPFKRISMVDAVKEYAGVDFSAVETVEEARELAKAHNIAFEERHKIGDILNLFFEEYAEKKLVQPTFLTGHPVDISPLAKKDPKDPRYTERFELFFLGGEFANAFSELNDPIDQRERFEAQARAKAQGDEEACDVDEDFLNALSYGMPPTGGLGIGVDRLVMLLTDASSIRDVLLFPTMKPIGEKKAVSAAPAGAAVGETIDFSKVEIEPLFRDFVDFETFSKSDFRAVKVIDCVAVPKSKKLLQFTLDDGTGTNRTILSGIHAFYEPEDLIGKTCVAITNLPPRAMMGIESCGMLLSAIHKEDGEEKLNLLQLDPHIPAGAKLY